MGNAKLEIANGVIRMNGKVYEDVKSVSITIESLGALTYEGEMVAYLKTADAHGVTEAAPMLVNRITVDFLAKGAG